MKLSRDTIKYIAAFLMLLNHIGNIFLAPGSALWIIFVNSGYATAITMCYFLAEGYGYTKSKKKYALRLALFAVISQAPFTLAFSAGKEPGFVGFDMLFSLLICFFVLLCLEKVENRLLRGLLIAGLFLISAFCDWPVMAPAFTVGFYHAGGDRRRVKEVYLISIPAFGLMQYLVYDYFPPAIRLINAAAGMLGMGISAFLILYLYSGKRSEKGRAFSKWFFYIFYPAHLLILAALKSALL